MCDAHRSFPGTLRPFDAAAFRARGFDRAAARALFARLGLPGAIDVHCHFMRPEVMAAVWRWFDTQTGGLWPVVHKGTDAERAAALRDAGIVRYTTLSYAHRPGMADWLNAWTLAWADAHPEAIGTATFFPEEGVEATVDAALAHGAVRAFKLHVQVGGFDPDDPRLHPAYARIEEAGSVIVIHVGSAPLPGAYTGRARFERVVRRFPRLRFVVAHMGASECEAFVELAERHESVSLDTSMVFVDFLSEYPAELLPRLAALRERVLFGTDFPNLPYPLEHTVESLVRLGLGDDWLRAVLHDNAARLLRLDAPRPAQAAAEAAGPSTS